MGGVLLMLCLCYVMLVKCRRRYSSQNGLGLGGPALWVTARVVHPQVCPFGPQIGHADKPCSCTLREEVSTSTTPHMFRDTSEKGLPPFQQLNTAEGSPHGTRHVVPKTGRSSRHDHPARNGRPALFCDKRNKHEILSQSHELI
jgi:hypothetical protein